MLVERELLDTEDAERHRVMWKGAKLYLIVSIDEEGNPVEIFAKLPQEAGIDGKGAFSVSFTARCVDGGADLSDMVVDVALTLRPGKPAVPLLKNAKFGALLAARGIERLPDCNALQR